jgi:hypothetical protein
MQDDRVAGHRVAIELDEILQPIPHVGHVTDDENESIGLPGSQALDTVHRQVEVLGIETAEALIQEERIEAAPRAGDHLGKGKRERQRCQKGLASGK